MRHATLFEVYANDRRTYRVTRLSPQRALRKLRGALYRFYPKRFLRPVKWEIRYLPRAIARCKAKCFEEGRFFV